MHTHSQVSYHLSVFVIDLLMPNSEPHSVCDGHELPQCSHHPGPSPQLYSLERRDYYSGTPTAGHVVPLLPFKFLHVYVPLQCNSLLTHLHSPKMHVCVHSHDTHTHNVIIKVSAVGIDWSSADFILIPTIQFNKRIKMTNNDYVLVGECTAYG